MIGSKDPSQIDPGGSRRSRYKWLPAVLLLTFFVYGPTLTFEFVGDDRAFLIDNPKLRATPVRGFFEHGVWEFSNLETGRGPGQIFRPLFLLNHRIQAAIWDEEPAGYHLLAVLAHTLASAMVFLLLASLVPQASGRALALATAIFAVHPVHVESVAWIFGATDVWAALGLLCAALLMMRAPPGKDFAVSIGVGIFALMAMLTKEVAYTAPALMLVLCSCVPGRITRRRLVAVMSGTAVAVGVALILRSRAVAPADLDLASTNGWLRLFEYTAGYVKYAIFPWPARFYLEIPADGPLAGWEIAVGAGALLFLPVAVWYSRANARIPLCAAAWFAVTLAPALIVAFHSVRPTFATRVMYLGVFGVALFALWAMTHTKARTQRLVDKFVAATVLIFAASNLALQSDWKSEEAFLAFCIRSNAEHRELQVGLGDLYAGSDRMPEALVAYRRAAAPEADREVRLLGLERLGETFGRAGRLEESRGYFEQMLTLSPNHSHAHTGLGNIAWIRGELPEARRRFELALESDPHNTDARINLERLTRAMTPPEANSEIEERP